MEKLYKLLSAGLAFSFVVAILVLALTPAPVEAGPPVITWTAKTYEGSTFDIMTTRKVAKYFCGVPLGDKPKPEYKGETIIYMSKQGTNHNICRIK